MKHLLAMCALVFAICGQASAAELSPDNIIGQYKVSASVGFQKVYLNFHVIDRNVFEIQRVYPSGKQDEVCNGTYSMNTHIAWNIASLAINKVFRGKFTCPSNRSKNIDFNIDFKNRTTEDLAKGTTVVVTSSLAPGYSINAHVKKQ